jgi:hypothetical protein
MSQCYILSLYVVHLKGVLDSGESQAASSIRLSLVLAGMAKGLKAVVHRGVNIP